MRSLCVLYCIVLLLLSSACKSRKAEAPLSEINKLTTARVQELDGREVVVEGTYLEMNVQKRPNSEPVYVGRVYIMLADSSIIILETQDEGFRPKDEIEMFRNQKVRVSGTYYQWCTAWGEGSQSSIVGACIKEIKSLEKVR